MRLRIATLNVWGLPEPLSVSPRRRLDAIGARLPALDADVVAFQEVWFASARERLLAAGKRAGLPHAWSPARKLRGSGLLVLSRLRIEAAVLSPFVLSGLPERVTHGDFYGGKGYLMLRLATPVGPVAIVATHLHARYSGNVSRAYQSHRAGQVVQLALGTAGLEQPLIAAGDFNFTYGSKEQIVLRGLSGLRDLAREAGHAENTVLRSNPFRANSRKPDRRVDYIFARDGSGLRVRTRSVRRIFDEPIDGGTLAYSNHAGVLAEVAIEHTDFTPGFSPSLRAIEIARELLAAGREAALRRREGQREASAAGLATAALLATCDRWLAESSRRRFLRTGLQLAAFAALAPSVGCSVLSEVFVPDEIRAYDSLARALERLQAGLLTSHGTRASSIG